jgi:RNA polymerase sigma factor (sigma-70 family)
MSTEDEDTLCRRHMPLVVSIAKRLAPNHLLDDAIGAGSLALLLAIRGFDPARGFAFSTYAHAAIERRVKNLLLDLRYPVRLPKALSDQKAAQKAVHAERVSNWDRPAPEDEGEAIDRERTVRLVRHAVSCLSPAQERAVRARYGIESETIHCTEYGRIHGVSRAAMGMACTKARENLRADLAHLVPPRSEGRAGG